MSLETAGWSDHGLLLSASRNRPDLHPEEVEFALGIFKEEIDPLIREAVITLALKGYNPVDSCQGRTESGHISLGSYMSRPGYEILKESGITITATRGYKVTDADVPSLKLYLPHNDQSPQQFRFSMVRVAEKLPKIGGLIYHIDHAAVLFRSMFGFEGEVPEDRVSLGLNPVFEQRAASKFYRVRRRLSHSGLGKLFRTI